MNVNEAAEFLNISKEAIHNRIRRGSIEVLVENGTKMVILDSKEASAKPRQTAAKAITTTINTINFWKNKIVNFKRGLRF